MIEVYYPSYFQAEVSVVAKLKGEVEALVRENLPTVDTDVSEIPESTPLTGGGGARPEIGIDPK
jgi:hypothetical protein